MLIWINYDVNVVGGIVMSKERELLRKISRKTHLINYDEIEAILVQPEQEHVAWMYDWNTLAEEEYGETKYDCVTRAEVITHNRAITNIRPLYTAPPKREPLTATQIDKVVLSQLKEYGQLCDKSDFELFASSIEKAHGIGVDDE
jgi:hypothetical protein